MDKPGPTWMRGRPARWVGAGLLCLAALAGAPGSAAAQDLEAPAPSSPVYGQPVVNPRPTFLWRPSDLTGGVRYTLEVARWDDPDFADPLVSRDDLEAADHTLTEPLPRASRYRWRVTATLGAQSAVSRSMWFVVRDRESLYRVQVARDGDFDWGLTWGRAQLTGTSARVPDVEALEEEGTYGWRVHASDPAGNTATSATRTFTLADNLSPNPPLLVSPVFSQPVANPRPTFIWRPRGRVTGTRYVLELAREDDPDFAEPLVRQAGLTATHHTLSQPLARDARYRWRVTADNGDDTAVSLVRSFVVRDRDARYRVEVARDGDFEWGLTWGRSGLAGTSAQVPEAEALSEEGSYGWRVLANDPAGNTAVSPARTFRLADNLPPNPPLLVSPVFGQPVANPRPTLVWRPRGRVTGTRFLLELAREDDRDFADPLVRQPDLAAPHLTVAQPLERGARYRWRVTADNGDDTAVSLARSFVVRGRDSAYRVEVARDGDFEWGLTWGRSGLAGTSAQIPEVEALTDEGSYGWRVLATDPAGNTALSPARTFRLADNLLPTPPLLVSPVFGQPVANPRPTLVWRPRGRVTGTRFLLELAREDDPGFADPLARVADLAVPHHTLAQPLERRERYRWRVTASHGESTAVSLARSFSVRERDSRYRVEVARDGDYEWGLTWARSRLAGTSAQIPEAEALADEATYGWRVLASDPAGNTATSPSLSFTLLEALTPLPPLLVSPVFSQSVINQRPTLSWRPRGRVTGARYLLEVAREDDPGFTEPVARQADLALPWHTLAQPLERRGRYRWRVTAAHGESTAVSLPRSFSVRERDSRYRVEVARDGDYEWGLTWARSGLAETSAQVPETAAFEDEGTYGWRVLASDPAGNAATSPSFRFTQLEAVVPKPPLLVSPVFGQEVINPRPTLVWHPQGRVTGTSYVLEVAREDDPGFAHPVARAADLAELHHTLTDPLDREAGYRWRVTASRDGDAATSLARTFGVRDRRSGYRVQVAKDGDFDWGLAWDRAIWEAQLDETSVQVPETEALRDEGSYGWRVLAVDPAGNTALSAVFTLVIRDGILPGPPLLTSPVFGQAVINPRPTFTWRPVGRRTGVSYLFEVTRGDDPHFRQIIARVTDLAEAHHTLAGALERDREYLWRVTASLEPDAAVSLPRSFSVRDRDSRYQVQVARDGDFEWGLVWKRSMLDRPSVQLPGPGVRDEGSYAWRVQSTDPAGNAATSGTFTLEMVDGIPPVPPLPLYPVASQRVLNPQPTLLWQPRGRVTGVTYLLELAREDDPGFAEPVLRQADLPAGAFSVLEPLDKGLHYLWRVGAAWRGAALWSSPKRFHLEQYASTYDLEVATDEALEEVEYAAAALPETSHEVPLMQALTEHTPYSWRVTAEDPFGRRTASEVFGFEIGRDGDFVRPGGLLAEYHDGTELDDRRLTRLETEIDQPDASDADLFGDFDTGLGGDTFSARWEGYVLADLDEEVTFHATSSDGQRLEVAGELLVDDWVQHNPETRSATIHLTAGWHPLRYEYFEAFGAAQARLEFESDSVPRQVIPADHLAIGQGDWEPPVIEDVYVDAVTPGAAVVVFSASEPVTGVVDVGRDDGYGLRVAGEAGSDRIRISGLSSGTAYHYRLTVRDLGGNETSTGDLTFCTPGPSDVVSGLLLAAYHAGIDLDDPVVTRTESTIDQPARSDGNPRGDFDSGVGPDDFSVRWTGIVRIPEGGVHTWYATSDDGQRLFVDGQRVVNDWESHPATTRIHPQTLDAGWHALTYETYDHVGDALARLEREGPDTSRQLLSAGLLGYVRGRFYAPTIQPREEGVTVECVSPAGAPVQLTRLEASDCRDPAAVVEGAVPDVLPLGESRVVWKATNRWGDTSYLAEHVTVVDTLPPTVSVPAEWVREATSPLGSPIELPEPQVGDLCDEAPDVSYHVCADGRGRPCTACWTEDDTGAGRVPGRRNPECLCEDAPARFELGSQPVTVIATDAGGSCGSGVTEVVVRDTTPPTVVPGEFATVCRSAPIPRAVVLDNATRSDEIDLVCRLDTDEQAGSCDREVTFDLGPHWVEYVATDALDNTRMVRLEFVVADGDPVPPIVELVEVPDGWTSGQAEVVVRATDNCDPDPAVAFTPEADEVQAVGGVHKATYSGEGVHVVDVVATDESGSAGTLADVLFGIDDTPPAATLSGLDAVEDPEDTLTWPAFLQGEAVHLKVAATDLAGGGTSGVASVTVELEHLESGWRRTLHRSEYGVDFEEPPSGPLRLKNLRCDDVVPAGETSVCDGGDVAAASLAGGGYRLRATVVDVAGNTGTADRHLVVMDWRRAVERTAAVAAALLEGDLPALTALLLTQVTDQRDAAILAVETPELLGNALLYTYTFLDALERAESDGRDTGATRLWLNRGAYAAVARLYDDAAEEVGEDDPDVLQADSFMMEARDFLEAGEPAHLASVLALENAHFYLRHALDPFLVLDDVEAAEAADRVLALLNAYLALADVNGRDPVERIVELQREIVVRGLLTTVVERHRRAPDAVNTAFLDVLVLLNRMASLLPVAQDQWVWTRNWQWPVSLQIRVLSGIGLEEAARALGDDPDAPADPLLQAARDVYDDGVELIDERLVDDALDVYVGARCLIYEVYNHAGFEPAASPPDEWGCEACVVTGDCPR